jgi:hypothetical protein
MILKKVITTLIFWSILAFMSCSKDDNNTPSSYPKSVKIGYRITGTIKKGNTIYVNETGGLNSLTDQVLPFTKDINATVKQFDALSLSVSSNEAGSAKLEILVNDKSVQTQTFSSNNFVSGTIAYVFP